ncbi:uncharacterized protein YneR [Bacillus ectoiniformans]|uniref:HesB/YadR/YfhF family protein n=1 Tax=Bacillus ectoiniformans TaxID=1494429 RepID=UPI001956CAE5|nr:HesB/YadR/YfhF family protein [Bacillus ectoiniformans]MBM7649249.1 uncharacterized protein YneR [Bacillus ectoiniformans]
MKIIIEDDALNWFLSDMEVKAGEYIRFYVRYGGSSSLHEGFSLGVTKEEPIDVGAKAIYHEAVFFVEEKDLWYFDGHDLHVNYDRTSDGPVYQYVKS